MGRREFYALLVTAGLVIASCFVAVGCSSTAPTEAQLHTVAQDARVVANELAPVASLADVAELASRVAGNLETFERRANGGK